MDALSTCIGARQRPCPADFPRTSACRPRLSTIAALAFALACPAARADSETYDPLLSESGNVCAPAVAGCGVAASGFSNGSSPLILRPAESADLTMF